MNTVSASLEIVQFIFETEKAIFRISTGSEEFDRILGGGFESMAITGSESHLIPTKKDPNLEFVAFDRNRFLISKKRMLW